LGKKSLGLNCRKGIIEGGRLPPVAGMNEEPDGIGSGTGSLEDRVKVSAGAGCC
jgi:hypothetical protein